MANSRTLTEATRKHKIHLPISCCLWWSSVIVIVQLLNHAKSQSPCNIIVAACQASLSSTVSRSLLKLMPSNHLILCCPLLLLPSVFPSIRVFSNELALCIRWPKCWSFSFSISPSSEYSRLIFFRIDWFDLAAYFIIS